MNAIFSAPGILNPLFCRSLSLKGEREKREKGLVFAHTHDSSRQHTAASSSDNARRGTKTDLHTHTLLVSPLPPSSAVFIASLSQDFFHEY